MRVVDLTLQLDESTPVYRDDRGYSDPPTVISTWIDIGDTRPGFTSAYRVSHVEAGLHTGTHVDAPAHFVPDGTTLEALPPGTLVGEAIVVDLRGRSVVGASHCLPHRERCVRFGATPLLLLDSTALLTPDAVEEIVGWRRPLLAILGGIDGNSQDCPATAALLRAGLFLAVDLAPAAAEVVDGDLLVVAPLSIRGVEGAPARVLAIKRAL